MSDAFTDGVRELRKADRENECLNRLLLYLKKPNYTKYKSMIESAEDVKKIRWINKTETSFKKVLQRNIGYLVEGDEKVWGEFLDSLGEQNPFYNHFLKIYSDHNKR